MGHLVDVLITIAVFIFAITQIWAFGKAFLKRQSAEPTNRMPSFGGDGPGGWVKQEMKRRSTAGKEPGTRPSFGGGGRPAVPAVRTEEIPADAGYRPPVQNDVQPAEAHYEGYERAADWEARKQRYAEQDRVNLEVERRQTDKEKKLADNLRRGVIWAEIIGPPRSKRPYGK